MASATDTAGDLVVITGLFWLAQPGEYRTAKVLAAITPQIFFYTFIIGNCGGLGMTLAAPLFSMSQELPRFWLIFLGVYIPVSAVSSFIASVAIRIAAGRVEPLFHLAWGEILAALFSRWSSEFQWQFRRERRGGSWRGIASWKGK